VPAAVIIIGIKRPYAFAATMTALYPAMFACDESTSMLWAREILGSHSMAKPVTPLSAKASKLSLLYGASKPTTICSRRTILILLVL
jgi:hypothetical protein